jgi:hypothetical protein
LKGEIVCQGLIHFLDSPLDRCQWKHEGTLRKHRIVNNRNRDTILYSMLNTDWIPASVALKKHIGLDWKPKTVKIADIQSGKEAVPILPPATKASASSSPSAGLSQSSPPTSSATAVSKKPPKKKSKTSKKRREKDESSSSDDEDEDELLVPMISTSQPKQKKRDANGVRRTDNISHAFISSVETPPPLPSAHDSSHPLDLSDPNLYVDDHAPIPLAAIDWQPVEKRMKKRK